ncbi:MAG TPA: hypothetical protein VFX60_18995 [Micromonospora sp.]|nr:hypothetical protein [Micromonospora sp.]
MTIIPTAPNPAHVNPGHPGDEAADAQRRENIDRAVGALRVFGATDRKTAASALGWWAHRHTLTDADRSAVLATFPEVVR